MARHADRPEITDLLDAWSGGDREALGKLMPLVIGDMRALAGAYMAREGPGHTLQPTALVNEAYLWLVGRRSVNFENRVHLFSVLAKAMRHILVWHARRKKAARRGGATPPQPLEEALGLPIQVDLDLVALDDALKALARLAPRQAEAIQLSYFGGLTFDEIALALGISPVTVKRDLKAAKIWLLHELKRSGGSS